MPKLFGSSYTAPPPQPEPPPEEIPPPEPEPLKFHKLFDVSEKAASPPACENQTAPTVVDGSDVRNTETVSVPVSVGNQRVRSF